MGWAGYRIQAGSIPTPCRIGRLVALLAGIAVTHADAGEPDRQASAKPVKLATVSYNQKLTSVDIEIGPDGLATTTTHIEMQALNDATARDISEKAIEYSQSMQELEIVDAYTLKADGEKLPVDKSAIFPQLPRESPDFPLFDDSRQKVIVFPDLSAGDTEIYTYRIVQKQPYFPGQFTYSKVFPQIYAYHDYRVTLSAPSDFPLYIETHAIETHGIETHGIEAHGLAHSSETVGNRTTHHWTYAAPDALAHDPSSVFLYENMPGFAVSSFKDYSALSRAYYALFNPKLVVTPKVQALANEITKGTSDRRQQAKLIYDWVSRHIRYVAIYFGNGGLVPHDVDAIIAHRYGDCKDHTLLFSALLKARNIQTEAVLINAEDVYSLPQVAISDAFNHLISWLPEFGLYADTTASVAPFGSLPMDEYGKPALHVLVSGDALRSTPVLNYDGLTGSLKSTLHMALDGTISGTSINSGTGPYSMRLRNQAMAIEMAGPERYTEERLGDGATGTFDFPPPLALADSYTISAKIALEPDPTLIGGKRFHIKPGLRLLPPPGDQLMGSINDKDPAMIDTTPCFSGKQIDDISLELPEGKRIGKVPADVEFKTSNLNFKTHWSLTGHVISVHREFVSSIAVPLCTGAIRSETVDAMRKIDDDYDDVLWLVDDGRSEQVTSTK